MCRENAKYVNEGLHFVKYSDDTVSSDTIVILFTEIVKRFSEKSKNMGIAVKRCPIFFFGVCEILHKRG